jgi:excisionase family DNA binding protein
MSEMLGKDLITIKDASERTGYNPEYLRRLIRQGKVDAEKLGTVYLVDVNSLDRYINAMDDPEDARTGPRS